MCVYPGLYAYNHLLFAFASLLFLVYSCAFLTGKVLNPFSCKVIVSFCVI